MSEKLTEKVSFDFIRYANCWEDAGILLQGLNPTPNSKILSIGSAGDNSFSLLTANPEMVLAVDISLPQLYLIELKKIGIKYFSYNELLDFLGFTPCDNRLKMFNEVKGYLSADAAKYWQANLEQIKKGIITQGKFEHYFQFFSNKILPLIHSRKTIETLLSTKSSIVQKQFYESTWNTWRWRLLFKIFFSKYVMGKYGRDPEFLKEVRLHVGDYIFKKAEKQLESIEAQTNFMLRHTLTGSFGNLLPHYLQPQNFEKIKLNIDKLIIKHGLAETITREYGKFNFMNLSNIFEYMGSDAFTNAADLLTRSTESGGKIAYWNLMVPRRISEILPEKATYQKDISENLTAIDKGFFYNQFIIDQII